MNINMTNTAKIKRDIYSLKEELKSNIKTMFEAGCKEIFAKYPHVKSFSWKQYPYYNDNYDVFRANFYINDLKVNGHDFDDINENDEALEGEETYDEIVAFLKGFEDDGIGNADEKHEMFKVLFGNYVSVMVTPEGVFIDECDGE